MSDEFIESVSQKALLSKEVTFATRQKLNSMINKHVRIESFRPGHNTNAPTPLKINGTIHNIKNNELCTIVLKAWHEASPDLNTAVINFLTNQPAIIYEMDWQKGEFHQIWSMSEMEAMVSGFLEMNNEFDRDDVSLMFCLNSGRLPMPDEIAEEARSDEKREEIDPENEKLVQEPSAMNIEVDWDPFLKPWSELPADSEMWNLVDEFKLKLSDLALIKSEEKNKSFEKVQKIIEDITKEHNELLSFFGLSDIKKWDPFKLTISSVGDTQNLLQQFSNLLSEYKVLDRKDSISLDERRKHRKDMENLEEKIQSSYRDLSGLLILFEQDAESTSSELKSNDTKKSSQTTQNEINGSLDLSAVSDNTQINANEKDNNAATSKVDRRNQKAGDEKLESPDISGKEKQKDQTIANHGKSKNIPISEINRFDQPVPSESGECKEEKRQETEPGVDSEEQARELQKANNEEEKNQASKDSQEINYLMKKESLNHDETFFWNLVRSKDVAGAYWLAKSFESSGKQLPLPSWLLATLVGSCILVNDSDLSSYNLLEYAQDLLPESDIINKLFGLTVALYPSLTAPFTGLQKLIINDIRIPVISEFVQVISDFLDLGITLNNERVKLISGDVQSSDYTAQIISEAKQWLSEAPSRRTNFKRASDVWRRFVSPDGDLYKLMKIVINDDQENMNALLDLTHQWSKQSYIIDQINEIDSKQFRTKSRPIEGRVRSQLIRYCEEACGIAQKWFESTLFIRETQKHGNSWLIEQITYFRNRILDILPKLRDTFDEMSSDVSPVSIQAVSIWLSEATNKLARLLHLTPRKLQSVAKNEWAWISENINSVSEVLNRRLLWLPELEVNDDGSLAENQIQFVSSFLLKAHEEKRGWQEVYRKWIEKSDFRFIHILNDLSHEEIILPDYQDQLIGLRSALREEKMQVTSLIEQAVVDGIIEDERSELGSELESINPDTALNISQQHSVIVKIRDFLEKAKNLRLVNLQKDWDDLKKKVNESKIDQEKKNKVENLVSSAFTAKDTRLLDEYMARLLHSVESGTLQDEDWIGHVTNRDELGEFIKLSPSIEDWLYKSNLLNVSRDIRNQVNQGGISYSNLSKPRCIEAADTIEAWRSLKQNKMRSGTNPLTQLRTILNFLGFSFDPSGKELLKVVKYGEDFLYTKAKMSASNLARPIPQFGSSSQGNYHVICLWERPGAETLMSRILQLGLSLDNIIVFYFGLIKVRQRNEIISMTNEHHLAMALLDDTLLVFLSQERDSRLPVFLRCSLPFASLNPYTPFQAGDVPPEMFYGRKDKVIELQRSDGSCIVYGGRQLGKSALLRQVQSEFHNPTRNQYAAVIDIKLIGDPTIHPKTDMIWWKIRDCLKELGRLNKSIYTDKTEDIARHIREMMNSPENSATRIIIILDEADTFLDTDSNDNFRITESLRTLMFDTQRRFKVIFAGLHNVQRFQALPNQPLAHFGTPIEVGPLESKSALELIREPLFVLGYRFENDADILRILSYTNYHPGLIQLFCQQLLIRMRGQVNKKPPFTIHQNDIEAIYLLVRERIRERFSWTLALDPAYQAIAWSMSEDQIQLRDGYSRSYSADEVLSLVRYWWQTGFPNDVPYLRSILTEMIGLGVLVQDRNFNYRLKSPNLVRLMGTETEIQEQLLNLSEKEISKAKQIDHYHAPLDESRSYYSTLNYGQMRDLKQRKNGVGMIFASNALGLKDLKDTLKLSLNPDNQQDERGFKEIPLYISNDADLKNWMNDFRLRNSQLDYLIAYHSLEECSAEEIFSLLYGAIEYYNSKYYKKQVTQLIFAFDPQSTWRWLSINDGKRREIENQAAFFDNARLWDQAGIQQRLTLQDKIANDDVCKKVIESTGGWPLLIDELFNRIKPKDDPRDIGVTLRNEVVDQYSPLHNNLWNSIGLFKNRVMDSVLKSMVEEVNIPFELIRPELLDLEKSSETELHACIEYLRLMNIVITDGELLHMDAILRELIINHVA